MFDFVNPVDARCRWSPPAEVLPGAGFFFEDGAVPASAILKMRRNRLILHARLFPRFEEKRLHFNDGWLTLNQRVQGSSPCAPTNEIKYLAELSDRRSSQKSKIGRPGEDRFS
jgi:hypothetical protein